VYAHACICTSLSNISSGNEPEIDNLAGRSARNRNVSLHLSVQETKIKEEQRGERRECRKTRKKKKLKKRNSTRRTRKMKYNN